MDDKYYLKLAIAQAKKSIQEGGFPAGAIVVKDGQIISEGISLGHKLHDPTEHAEISAIRKACKNIGFSNLHGAILYASLESCNMCFSASYWSGIRKIVYARRKSQEMVEKFYYEGNTGSDLLNESNNNKIELVYIPDFEKECLELVKEWEEKNK